MRVCGTMSLVDKGMANVGSVLQMLVWGFVDALWVGLQKLQPMRVWSPLTSEDCTQKVDFLKLRE
jgi:hypothetical protein